MNGFRFLTDEDFDNVILRGLLRRMPGLDAVRVQDVGLAERWIRPSSNGQRWKAVSC